MLAAVKLVLAAGLLGVIAWTLTVAAALSSWYRFTGRQDYYYFDSIDISPLQICSEYGNCQDSISTTQTGGCMITVSDYSSPFKVDHLCDYLLTVAAGMAASIGLCTMALFFTALLPCMVSYKAPTQIAVAAISALFYLGALLSTLVAASSWESSGAPTYDRCNHTHPQQCRFVGSEQPGRDVAWAAAFFQLVCSILTGVVLVSLCQGKGHLSTAYDRNGPLPAWGGGLFALCADIPVCCITWWLPCITAGENFQDSGQGSCGLGGLIFCCAQFAGLVQCFLCWQRSEILSKFGLGRFGLGDVCAVIFCPLCVLAQDRRGLKALLPSFLSRHADTNRRDLERAPLLAVNDSSNPPPYAVAVSAPHPSPLSYQSQGQYGYGLVPLFDPYTGQPLQRQPQPTTAMGTAAAMPPYPAAPAIVSQPALYPSMTALTPAEPSAPPIEAKCDDVEAKQ